MIHVIPSGDTYYGYSFFPLGTDIDDKIFPFFLLNFYNYDYLSILNSILWDYDYAVFYIFIEKR